MELTPRTAIWVQGSLRGESQLVDVHLRATRYGGQPSRGLPTVAHAIRGKRERRLAGRLGRVSQLVLSGSGVVDWCPSTHRVRLLPHSGVVHLRKALASLAAPVDVSRVRRAC